MFHLHLTCSSESSAAFRDLNVSWICKDELGQAGNMKCEMMRHSASMLTPSAGPNAHVRAGFTSLRIGDESGEPTIDIKISNLSIINCALYVQLIAS